VAWITLISRFLTGNALWALHVISALVCAGIIILTGLMARLLGSTGWVQGLAALGSATSLVLLAGGSTYTYDVFDQFWWALAATVLIVLLRDGRSRLWLAFGVVAGLGLLTKETMLFWGFALVVGLLLTPERRLLFTRWTLLGGLIALVIFSPFLLWNAANGWASFQYWAGYSANHSGGGTPIDFVANQIVINNPFLLPLWGPGGRTGQVIISINVAPQDGARSFGSVTLAARTSCKACVDFENNVPILILRDQKEPFSVLWAQAKMYE
jgi:4-amino-4-deoxy-L-arabinose transferase-like glycosyltransferase